MPERSHYDVLGVSPGAKPDAIRRAYLRQARRWHPDRPTGDSERMRAVNEAWEVLGDIRSRAAYDRKLARSAPGHPGSPRPAGATRPTGSPRPAASPRTSGTPPRPQTPSLEVVSIRWRWISLAAVVLAAVAVAVIFLATSAIDDSDPDDPIAATAPVSESRPEPGDCFRIGTTTLITVPCDHPHDGKLVRWVPLGAPCPPDTELRWVRSAQEAVCYHPPSG
ncbi:J domain-containing protein [Candidatus Poriferisocius sp.]|uniref:J domain-containing protein n=1 Tax=Candidatus Poriferisocius sp. TaxID=3101276 RepID=UPI003B020BCE